MRPKVGLDVLGERLRAGRAVVAGVLSGTSGDGIDVALVRFAGAVEAPRGAGAPGVAEAPVAGTPVIGTSVAGTPVAGTPVAGTPVVGTPVVGTPVAADVGRLEPLAFETRPFPADLAPRVRRALDGGATTFADTARLDRDLGLAFGAAAREVAERSGLALDLVASHGLTVFHHDGSGAPASLQLGEGDFVAEAAGCAVACDFRQRDLASGGEGAPISALADDAVFAHLGRPLVVLNLGGLANLTLLAPEPEPGLAFDTGPAGCLLDGLARRLLDAPCDVDGAFAAGGRADPDLVAALLRHPFFGTPPPRSTGRDTFGEAWVDRVVEELTRRRGGTLDVGARRDLAASAVEVVAAAVGRSLAGFVPARFRTAAERVLVAGGGVHNRTLMAALRRHCAPLDVVSSAEVGVDPDAREALVFAVLGARCALGVPTTRTWATGAAPGRVLGKLCGPAASSGNQGSRGGGAG